MDFLIGRDEKTNQLRISTPDGRILKQVGLNNSVPMNVSRKHLRLSVDANRVCTVTNLNPANQTRVNGMLVSVKQANWGDRIELGASLFPLDWAAIEPLLPKVVDISSLKKIWDQYKQRDIEIQKRTKSINILASVPVVFTIGSGLVTSLLPEEMKSFGMVITGIGLIIMIIGLYIRISDKSIEEKEELRQWFIRYYVCPECGHFLGFTDYTVLSQNKACSYCRTQFKK